jgi:hypothetical protein
MTHFSAELLETAARAYIQRIYSQAGLPLPDGWDDPDILQSLSVDMSTLEQNLATQPELRQHVLSHTPGKQN